MHVHDVSQPKASEPRRRRAGKGILIFAVCSIAIAGLALVFAPVWLPRFPGGDKALIRYERSQRHLRAEFGLEMPGQPDLTRFTQRLAENGVTQGAPILIRIFKREFELELWMQRDGVFHRFAIYPICRWSGRLRRKASIRSMPRLSIRTAAGTARSTLVFQMLLTAPTAAPGR